jgi:hypothetical protein
MRKLFTILAILGFSIGFTALTASADTTVDYTLNGTFGSLTGFPSTSISNAGDSFTITFSLDQTLLVPMMGNPFMTANIPVTFDYIDFLGSTVNFSLTGQAGILVFFDASAGGLFTLDFPQPPNGDDFFLSLFGTSPAGFLGSSDMNSGTFAITPGDALGNESIFTETSSTNLAANSVSGTVTATPSTTTVPEPSSLLLLGSGFLALGGFARKRLIARFN